MATTTFHFSMGCWGGKNGISSPLPPSPGTTPPGPSHQTSDRATSVADPLTICDRSWCAPGSWAPASAAMRFFFWCYVKAAKKKNPQDAKFSSWWLNQPTSKICSSNWIISPSRDENSKDIWNHHLVRTVYWVRSCVAKTITTCICLIFKKKLTVSLQRIASQNKKVLFVALWSQWISLQWKICTTSGRNPRPQFPTWNSQETWV